MKRQSKLTSRQSEQEQQLSHQESQQHTAHEFATVEEMLRHDARHSCKQKAFRYGLGNFENHNPPRGGDAAGIPRDLSTRPSGLPNLTLISSRWIRVSERREVCLNGP